VIITYILELMPGFVNVIAVGHLGEAELAAISLAAMFCNVTGFTVGMGLATAMDTLCSQAFGANNKRGLGVVLQRALLIELAFCLPIGLIWIFAEPILLGLGQDPRVSELSGQYCQLMLIGLYPFFVYEVLKKFLQAQACVLPQMFIAIIANAWTVGANFLFVYTLDMGFTGAPLARLSTNCILPLLTIIYMVAAKKTEGTWDGWTMESLQKWKEFLQLGIPGMLMLCVEWWCFEVLTILAGIIGTTELAAQSIIYNVVLLTYFIPYGISVATSVMIGNVLGKGWDSAARTTTKVSYYLVVGVEILAMSFLIGLRNYIPLIFTQEPEVIELAASVLPVAAGYQLFDGLAAVSGGVLRGCGKQKIGALINFVGYCVFGLPSSAALAFLTDLELMGLWVGVFVALVVCSIIAIIIVVRIDWKYEVAMARERVLLNLGH